MFGRLEVVTMVTATSLLLVGRALASSVPLLPRQVETTPPDCTDVGTNGTIYEGVSENFEIFCGYDFLGGDYANIEAETFEDCIKACEEETSCVDITYVFVGQICYLKNFNMPATLNGAVHSARKIREPDTSLSCLNSGFNDTTYSDGTVNEFHILCGVDYFGGDMGAVAAETFADCVAACDAADDCLNVAYAFQAQTCYLKNVLTSPVPADAVWTAVKKVEEGEEGEEQPETTVVTCVGNASNNTLYQSAGSTFLVLCGVDYAGGDMGGSPQPTFADCMDACDAEPDCVDVSYVGDFCYMKNVLTTRQTADWSWTGKKVPATFDPENPTPDPEPPLPSGLTCEAGAMDGQSFTAASGNEYTIICGREYPGGDLQTVDAESFEACVEACDTTPTCIDVSYVGPACYLKNTLTTLQDAAWVSTARLLDAPPGEENPVVTSLSCVGERDNGTTYVTPAGNEYEILCSIDYFGGDMFMVLAESFEVCIQACDANEGCIDVAYSGTACYLKDTLTVQSPADWVWNALYVGKAATTTSTSADPTATSSQPSSATETPCSTEPASKFLPSQDIDVDRSAPERLTPALEVELNYAEQPGNRILQMGLVLSTPAVVLENIAQVTEVTCTETDVSVTFASIADLNDAVAAWDGATPLLITYAEGCNIETARGFWTTTAYTYSIDPEPVVLFAATQANLTDVATEATLKYGTIDAGAESFTSTVNGAAVEPTVTAASMCDAATTTDASTTTDTSMTSTSTSSTASATPTESDRPLPETLEDLTPAARELFDFLMANLPLDANGNLNYNVPPQTVTELEVAPYDPDDIEGQQELEDMFQEAGLDSPQDLVAKASTGVQGVCEAPAATIARRLLQPSRRVQRDIRARARARNYAGWLKSKLQARDGDGWDIACDDMVTGLVGLLPGGGLLEGVCAGKSLWDNRDAFKCLFGGCRTTTYIITKTTTYDFNYAWKIDFPNIQGWLTRTGPNKVLSCVNCGFSVSNIAFVGKIVVSITEGVITIQSAEVTPGISGTANMVVRLQSDGAYSGDWNHIFKTVDLGAIQMDSAFKITPTVLYGLGLNFATDSTIDVTAGASFSWNGAAAPINIMRSSLVNKWNWQPSVSFTLPSFKTGAEVSIKPYMRWLVKLEVDIYGMVKISPTITSQTAIGIDSKYSFAAANGCPANSLKVSTYLNTANTIAFGDGTGAPLYSGQAASANQCFSVPGLLPSPEEIETLKSVGGPYCTSYMRYVPPVTVSYTTSTATVPSTTTTYSTVVVTSTTTIYQRVTTTFDSYSTTTLSAATVTVTASNKTPNFALINARRAIGESMPTPTASLSSGQLDKRQAVPQPAVAAGWDATKISFACKQVATGTSTRTQTVPTTVTSGVTTASAVITRNANGPLVTVTYTVSTTRFLGQKTTTLPGTKTKTVCPTPQATSCFRLKPRGAWWVEDKYVRFSDYGGFNPDRVGYEYDTFYLSASGRLVGYNAAGTSFVLGTYHSFQSANFGGEVLSINSAQTGQYAFANCWKDADPCSKGFQCKIISATGVERVGMSLQEPVWRSADPLYGYSGFSENSYRFAWGIVTSPGYTWIPVTFTYEDVPCPCY